MSQVSHPQSTSSNNQVQVIRKGNTKPNTGVCQSAVSQQEGAHVQRSSTSQSEGHVQLDTANSKGGQMNNHPHGQLSQAGMSPNVGMSGQPEEPKQPLPAQGLTTNAPIPSEDKAQFSGPSLLPENMNPPITQPRNLPRSHKEWSKEDCDYFESQFNSAQTCKEVKGLLNGVRSEKIAQICLKLSLEGHHLDMQKVKKWFVDGDDSRSRSPIVKVCGDGAYIRISHALAERYGFTLMKGQEFQFGIQNEGGKQMITLTLIP